MKKILALSILLSMVLVSIPVTIAIEDGGGHRWVCDVDDDNQFGGHITTKARVIGGNSYNYNSGGGQGGADPSAPIIKCKWEYDLEIELPPPDPYCYQYCRYHDACPWMPGLQVHPDLGRDVAVGYFAVVTDQNGVGHIDHVFADVWHPNCEFKYEIELFPYWDPQDTYRDYDQEGAIEQWKHVTEKHHSLINYGVFELNNPSWTNDEDILWELEQGHAVLYYGVAYLSYCQPAGNYCVGVRAMDGFDLWSDYLFNKFWYIPTAAAVIDFKEVNYGDVAESVWNRKGGDQDMETPSLHTVKNVGNTPIYFSIWQDDMKFGKTNPGLPNEYWNVEYRARLTDDNTMWTNVYKPEVETTLPGYLGMCTEEKLDFEIHVLKGFTGFGPTTGMMHLYAHIYGEQADWISPMVFDPAPYFIDQTTSECGCQVIPE